jgi:predicted dehydrogenase
LLYCDIVPHATDWVLNLAKSEMVSITGFSHTFPDRRVTNEDQMRAIVSFANGTVADITRSHVSYMRKPQWRILGTKGAIIDTAKGAIKGYPYNMVGPSGGSFTLIKEENGKIVESEVPYKESQWGMFYRGVAQHLLFGKPAPVTGEEGRRTVVIMETAGKSAESGRTEPVPYK